MKVLAGSSWGFTIKLWWPRIRLSYPLAILPLSGSFKCPLSTWTNLRWSRTRLRGSRQDAIQKPRCPTSEPRLESSPWGRTWNFVLSSFMVSPFNPCTPVTLSSTSYPPPPPRPPPLRATLQGSFYRTLRGLQIRVTTSTTFPSSMVACWSRAHIPWPDASTRSDDWGYRPVSGGQQQGSLGCPPTSGPSRTVAATVL